MRVSDAAKSPLHEQKQKKIQKIENKGAENRCAGARKKDNQMRLAAVMYIFKHQKEIQGTKQCGDDSRGADKKPQSAVFPVLFRQKRLSRRA